MAELEQWQKDMLAKYGKNAPKKEEAKSKFDKGPVKVKHVFGVTPGVTSVSMGGAMPDLFETTDEWPPTFTAFGNAYIVKGAGRVKMNESNLDEKNNPQIIEDGNSIVTERNSYVLVGNELGDEYIKLTIFPETEVLLELKKRTTNPSGTANFVKIDYVIKKFQLIKGIVHFNILSEGKILGNLNEMITCRGINFEVLPSSQTISGIIEKEIEKMSKLKNMSAIVNKMKGETAKSKSKKTGNASGFLEMRNGELTVFGTINKIVHNGKESTVAGFMKSANPLMMSFGTAKITLTSSGMTEIDLSVTPDSRINSVFNHYIAMQEFAQRAEAQKRLDELQKKPITIKSQSIEVNKAYEEAKKMLENAKLVGDEELTVAMKANLASQTKEKQDMFFSKANVDAYNRAVKMHTEEVKKRDGNRRVLETNI